MKGKIQTEERPCENKKGRCRIQGQKPQEKKKTAPWHLDLGFSKMKNINLCCLIPPVRGSCDTYQTVRMAVFASYLTKAFLSLGSLSHNQKARCREVISLSDDSSKAFAIRTGQQSCVDNSLSICLSCHPIATYLPAFL